MQFCSDKEFQETLKSRNPLKDTLHEHKTVIGISIDDLDTILTEIIELGKKVETKHDLRAYSEKVCFFCSIILRRRFGEFFNGIYPFCGLDVLTPYLLGGNWLLFDTSWNDYQTEIPKYQIPYFKEAITSDRLRIIDRSIEASKEEVIDFKPEVVLIKYAGEGNYERIFDFLKCNFKSSPLLIISCTSRELEKYLDHYSGYRLSSVKIGSLNEISIGRQLQLVYQTFYFLDRLKLFEFSKKVETLSNI
ncbi:MAG: hypothetical protein ACFFAE_07680 [Candidatus Hodarchaeota archaeon]